MNEFGKPCGMQCNMDEHCVRALRVAVEGA